MRFKQLPTVLISYGDYQLNGKQLGTQKRVCIFIG